MSFTPLRYTLKEVLAASVPRSLQLTSTPVDTLTATSPRSSFSICRAAAACAVGVWMPKDDIRKEPSVT
ncbi:hypothetical protein [Paenibacillus sp. PFR10]|uniref:Uncharacterized protein n=1 Tax=Paenibacillus violae TaxID=3077234 RepID=A0ABU3RPX2_9BACL|nr:hypothetical protein [Paenibacillus sp. PFR10]MDU0206219.1 hypothetical protein [Paenibacillus sp. PFR10]